MILRVCKFKSEVKNFKDQTRMGPSINEEKSDRVRVFIENDIWCIFDEIEDGKAVNFVEQ